MSLFFAASPFSRQTFAHSSISEIWLVKSPTHGEYSPTSLSTLTGAFVFLLTFLWLRASQLKRVVRQRDRQLKKKLVIASAKINPAIPPAPSSDRVSRHLQQSLFNRQQALRLALYREEFRVYYQPIVELQSTEIVGFEALVRWQHPKQGLLQPSDFLPLAEEMGIIAAIDRWMLKTVCQQLSAWQKSLDLQRFNIRPCLSINLSSAYLSQTGLTQPGLDVMELDKFGLVDYVRSLLTHYSITPQQINLEITESVMITNPEQVIKTLCQLREMGLRVSLDDFGTGYSSLSYLHQFPVDVLKIDQTFVRHLGHQHHSSNHSGASPDRHQVIIQAILDLAKGLNLAVVAEGIEQSCQHYQLKQMHCHYGQGNLFGQAVDAASAQALLALKLSNFLATEPAEPAKISASSQHSQFVKPETSP